MTKLTRTWRLLYLLAGVALLAYGVYGYALFSGLMLVFTVLGVLLLLRALSR